MKRDAPARLHSVARLSVMGFGFLLSLQPAFWNAAPVGTGMEISWYRTLCWSFLQGLRFGSDIIFTYGPLGFLATRLPVEGLKFYYCASDVLIYGGLLAVYIIVWRSTSSLREAGALALTTVPIGNPGILRDIAIVYSMLALFFLFHHARTKSVASMFAAIIYSLVCFFIKVNIGLLCLFLVFLPLVYGSVCGGQRKEYRFLLSALGMFFAAAVLFTNTDIPGYIIASAEFFRGYNDIMWLDYRPYAGQLFRAFLIAIVLSAAILASSIRTPRRTVVLQAGTMAFLFLFYKQSFIRADAWHIPVFFWFAPAALGILFFFAERDSRRLFGTGLIFTLILCFESSGFNRRLEHLRDPVSFARSYAHALISPPPRPKFRTRPLPLPFLQTIGQSSVDFIPGESGLAFSNQLNYVPRPVFQSYAAFTTYFDAKNAAKYRSASAPMFLVYEHYCIDDRYCFGDEPETKIAMREHYEVIAHLNQFLLLKRRGGRAAPVKTSSSTSGLAAGNWVQLPNTAGGTLLRAKVRYSLWGALRAFFLQPPKMKIEFLLSDNSVVKYRSGPSLLNAGVIVNPYIGNLESAEKFFGGESTGLPRAAGVRITAEKGEIVPDFEFELGALNLEDWLKKR